MKSEYKRLVNKLDLEFALYIKARDNYKSVTNGATENIECSHVIRRGQFATRWDEQNAFAQTKTENEYNEQHPEALEGYFISRFGVEELDKLKAKANRLALFNTWDLETMIEYYKKKRKGLQRKNH